MSRFHLVRWKKMAKLVGQSKLTVAQADKAWLYVASTDGIIQNPDTTRYQDIIFYWALIRLRGRP